MKRALLWILGFIVFLLLIVWIGGGYYFASILLGRPTQELAEDDAQAEVSDEKAPESTDPLAEALEVQPPPPAEPRTSPLAPTEPTTTKKKALMLAI